MPDVIRLLPEHVANQIAAGEVVQRPASVVKELLENALDAQATHIQLIIKDAGRSLIQIIDNGVGMSMTDARMAFERHATSKITQTEDIFSITTKGFRGEALASIAAVAQVELKTKKADDDLGTQLIIEANEVKKQEPIITDVGSSFLIKNLFYNVPARRKFLKSNPVEFRHILDEFLRVALTHSGTEFQLFHNGEEIYRFKKGSLGQRIVEVFGKKIQGNLVPFELALDWITLRGYLGKPDSAKKKRGEQYFFINNRYFRSPYFHKAVMDAYDGLLPPSYFPSYFIYIEMHPEMIDVNIHPSKTEIKFEKESDIYALLLSSIKQSLGVYNVAPSLDFDQDPQWQGTMQKNTPITVPSIRVDPTFNPFEMEKSHYPSSQEKIHLNKLYKEVNPETTHVISPEFETEMKPLRLHSGYWIWEVEEELWLIDPHRIHQTLLWEQLQEQSSKNSLSQQLLFPIEYPINKKEKHSLALMENELFKLGFELDYSTEFLTVLSIPAHLDQDIIIPLFDGLLGEMESHSTDNFVETFIRTAVKVSAKKKNYWQNEKDIVDLFHAYTSIHRPAYSPNKKPNYTKINLNDFIKKLQ